MTNTIKIVNLTPHTINLYRGDLVIEIPPSGTVARVSEKQILRHSDVGEIAGTAGEITKTRVDFYLRVFGDVEGIPDPADNVMYVVSSIVAARASHRYDLIIPNDLVRDDRGRVIGCRSFTQG